MDSVAAACRRADAVLLSLPHETAERAVVADLLEARPPLVLNVRKSKFYGAFVLNRRVDLHAIDATLLDGVAMPVPHRSTEPARPRHRCEMT